VLTDPQFADQQRAVNRALNFRDRFGLGRCLASLQLVVQREALFP